MWVTVNGVSLVDAVDGDTVAYNASVSDPLSTFDFSVDDPTLSINLDDFQEVIVWDENAPPAPLQGGGTVVTVPSMNYALNPSLFNNGFGTALSQWTETGTIPSSVWSYAQTAPALTFSNTAVGYALQYQNTLLGKVIPGVSYMFSIYVTGSGTLSNIQSIVKFDWFDANNTLLAGGPNSTINAVLGQRHISVSAAAPANAAYAQIVFGGQTTNATNSGVMTFTVAQFEPMWFVEQGVLYPTPDCNLDQINCVQMSIWN